MRVGDHVTTLPTTRPKYYANIRGEIVSKNGDEWGVEIKGRVVWFLATELAPQASTNGSSRKPAPQAMASTREGGPCRDKRAVDGRCTERIGRECIGPCVIGWQDRALTIPSSPVPASEAVSDLPAVSAAPRDLQRPMEGSRGPAGGMYARCGGCGQMWERPKQRGRPAARCPGCR